MMRLAIRLLIVLVAIRASGPTPDASAQAPHQPKVQPGPNEPDWDVILRDHYGLSMYGDLLNPVTTTPEATPGTFRKAGPGLVTFRPAIALGTEDTVRGGWYRADEESAPIPLWDYQYKNTEADLETGKNLPPPLREGSKVEFDPGSARFGLWISNDGFQDGGVFTEPARVRRENARLAKQPYKVMIYPYKDKATGKIVPHSYLLGVEYSTNDDFQDVVCRIDNVDLVTSPTP